jgi:hypothetical protein
MKLTGQWLITGSSESLTDLDVQVKLCCGYYLHCDSRTQLKKINADGFDLYVIGVYVNVSTIDLMHLNEENYIDWIIECVGNYCVLKVERGDIQIYTDPAAMMGVYYNAHSFASTVSLLKPLQPDELFTCFDSENDWFLGDITPYKGIKFLLANHFISIRDRNPVRFWPREPFNKICWSKGISQTASYLQEVIEHLVAGYQVVSSITGGKDSRLVMAAAKRCYSDIEFFTLRGSGVSKDDVSIVSELMKCINVSHLYLDIKPVHEDDLDAYDYISGGLAIGARREIISSMNCFKGKNLIHLNGNLGAIGKCYYWPSSEKALLSEEDLLTDFSSISKDKKDGIRYWLDTVPDYLSDKDVYNLMYLEQRGGRWMGIGENASSVIFLPFTPFSSRRVFEFVCGLPENELRDKDWHQEVTQHLSPELASVRYSRSTRKFTKFLPASFKRCLKKIKARLL